MAGNSEEFLVRFELDVSSAISNANRLSQSLGNVVGSLNSAGTAAQKMQGVTNGTTKSTTAATTATNNSAKATDRAARSIQNLSTTRYALYDVSSTLGIISAALLAIPVATIGVAVAFERDFANVRRTAQVSGDAATKLQQSLIDLSTTIPTTFADITQIAALGGQLGIASGDLTDFTSVVARLAATTDLSAEAAGTMLGRFQALLNVKGDQFEALASSILNVGINSVATESQIVNIATQISSMGDFAGLTADQVIGLAGALASVGAAPELSRGTITRTFSLISKAVAAGGENLQRFADIAGVSSDEFAASFGTSKFAGVFQSFLGGLDKINKSGGNAVVALNELGISSVRDVPLLLRMAGAGDVVAKAFSDAAEGWRLQNQLQNQYGIIANTTAARLKILVNNITELLNVLGQGASGPFSDFVDFLIDAVRNITAFLKTDFGQRIALWTVGVSTLVGVLTLLAAGLALAAASTIAMRQALLGLGLVAPKAVVQLTAVDVAARRAALGAKALGVALKAVSIIGLALVLPDVGNWASDTLDSMRGVSHALDDVQKSFLKPVNPGQFLGRDGIKAFMGPLMDPETIGRARALGDIFSGDAGDLKRLDEGFAQLANSGNIKEAKDRLDEVREAWFKAGGTQKGFNAAFPDTIRALKDAAVAGTGAADAMSDLDKQQLLAQASTDRLSAAIGITADELGDLKDGIAKGSGGFVNFNDLIQRVQDQTRGFAEKTSKAVYGSIDSWQQFYDGSSVNIRAFMAELDKQIKAQGKWADDLKTLSAAGMTAFVSEVAKMGPEGAPLAAAAAKLVVDGATGELNKLEDQARLAAFLASDAFAEEFTKSVPALIVAYRQGGIGAVQGLIKAQREEAQTGIPGAVKAFVDKWNTTYANKPISMPVGTDMSQAELALLNFYNRWNGMTINLRATGSGQLGSGILGPGRASGGPIYGPGTGTSDSINARLSNGEYVIRASSVRKYGSGIFDALNRGVARFANGGPVGSRSGSSAVGTGIMELGPRSLGRLGGGAPQVTVILDDVAIARAAARGQKQLSYSGAQ
jgi:phage tail tape measure protein, TP901 family, core region